MCHVCRCFGWTIDILQRCLTFLLACVMSSAICIGVTLAVGAGIAYGYNFSLAEYLDQKRSDITVYVRRGQFNDLPELQPNSRRSDGEDDVFTSNFTVDYQDQEATVNAKPLSDNWQRAQDTWNYARKLTKYSKMKANKFRSSPNEDDEMEELPNETSNDGVIEETPSVIRKVVFVPNQTTTSGDEQFRRNFEPKGLSVYSDQSNTLTDSNVDEYSLYRGTDSKHFKNRKLNLRKLKKQEVNIKLDDGESLHTYKTKAIPVMTQEEAEDADYYNAYKPV